MPNLEEDGYTIIRNNIDPHLGTNCIQNNKLDYQCIHDVINRKYFPSIVKHLPNANGASFRRFIFSSNRYSSMDSLYSGNSYNHTETNLIPIYCAYLYFSSGTLEVIPKSHLKSSKSNYGSRRNIHLEEGDVVILNTNLHNRNVNDAADKVLKIMDIFPNDKVYNMYAHNLQVVQLNSSFIIKYVIFSLIFISKIRFIIDSINCLYYYLVYYNVQYKILLSDVNSVGKLVAYEANGRKKLSEVNQYEGWNLNIICNNDIQTAHVGNTLTILLVLGILLSFSVFYFSCKNKNTNQCYNHIFEKYFPNYIKEFMTKYKIKPIINEQLQSIDKIIE